MTSVKQTTVTTIALRSLVLLLILSAASSARAQAAKTPYPAMAPLDQYLIADRNAEIALARSAAPDSISHDADVMVLTTHGYETAVKGKNGFVCIVERSWTTPSDDPQHWNPKLRGPLCLNPPAARTYLPLTIRKTDLVLAGRSKAQVVEAIKSGLDKGELPAIEPDAVSYMLAKQGYLNDHDGHWYPHLMFFRPLTDNKIWGADLPGSPILAVDVPEDRLTIVMIPVAKWSDGTPAPPYEP
jgi:hypothetical protein